MLIQQHEMLMNDLLHSEANNMQLMEKAMDRDTRVSEVSVPLVLCAALATH